MYSSCNPAAVPLLPIVVIEAAASKLSADRDFSGASTNGAYILHTQNFNVPVSTVRPCPQSHYRNRKNGKTCTGTKPTVIKSVILLVRLKIQEPWQPQTNTIAN